MSQLASALTSAHASREYLAFMLANERYAMDTLKVREIRSYETPAELVTAPD